MLAWLRLKNHMQTSRNQWFELLFSDNSMNGTKTRFFRDSRHNNLKMMIDPSAWSFVKQTTRIPFRLLYFYSLLIPSFV